MFEQIGSQPVLSRKQSLRQWAINYYVNTEYNFQARSEGQADKAGKVGQLLSFWNPDH